MYPFSGTTTLQSFVVICNAQMLCVTLAHHANDAAHSPFSSAATAPPCSHHEAPQCVTIKFAPARCCRPRKQMPVGGSTRAARRSRSAWPTYSVMTSSTSARMLLCHLRMRQCQWLKLQMFSCRGSSLGFVRQAPIRITSASRCKGAVDEQAVGRSSSFGPQTGQNGTEPRAILSMWMGRLH